MKKTIFSKLSVGQWFKETPDGTWYLKSSASRGQYHANGIDGEPSFDGNETVWVE